MRVGNDFVSNYTGQSARQIDEVINLSNSQSVNDSLFLTF